MATTINITTKLTGVAKVKSQLDSIGKSIDGISKRAREAGKQLSLRLTAPLAAVGAAAGAATSFRISTVSCSWTRSARKNWLR